MEIRDVSGYALSSPIEPPQQRRFHGGTRRLRKRDVVLVVVETADGERGFSTAGASSSAMREYFEGDSQGTFATVVDGPVADALEGATVETVRDGTDRLRGMDLPRHLVTEAVSAIDVALFDLLGKEHGAPIYELLAAETDATPTTELPLYASAGMYMEPSGYVRQAERLEELGFAGYKYRPGIGPEGDRRTVDALAAALDEMEIMLDVHTWWKVRPPYGRDVVRELIDHATAAGAYWIEEPVPPDDHEGYVDLAGTGAPLAGGESEDSADGLVDLAETGAVDFLQGDVRHHEGYTGCLDAIERCRDLDVAFVPHNFGTWLGLVANAHLVAGADCEPLLEYPVFEGDPALDAAPDPGMYPFDLAFDVVEDVPSIEDGTLTVPDGPGLGVDVDLGVIDSYPFEPGPWTEFHYDEE